MEAEYVHMGNVAMTRLLSFYALFVAVGILARCAIQSFAPSEDTSTHPMKDFVAAFEVYGCNIGHLYVFQIYGLGTYLIVLLTVGIYHTFFLKGCTANPITYVLQDLANRCPSTKTIAKLVALVFGGIVGHLTATAFWPVLMKEFDKETLAQMHCVAASSEMPTIVCLSVEFLGMVLTGIMVINIASLSVDAFEPPMKFLITCLLSGTGLYVSNVYLNPVVASSRLIGCDGKDLLSHLVVYWIASIGGAAVAVLYQHFTSHNSDLVNECLQSINACSELNADVDPDLPCLNNMVEQALDNMVEQAEGPSTLVSCVQMPKAEGPSTLVSYVQMPSVCVSKAEEDEEKEEFEEEEDENSDEVIYSCDKYLGKRKVNALAYDKQDCLVRRNRRTEQPSDDTYCREFRATNHTWPSGTVTFSKTYGIKKCAPLSMVGHHLKRLLCDDLRTISDITTNSCCGYREPLSCPCCTVAMRRPCCTFGVNNNMDSVFCPSRRYLQPSCCFCPTCSACRISGDQSYSLPNYISCDHKTDAQDVCRASADNYYPSPRTPTRQRSQLTTFIQPLRDNSQDEGTDGDGGELTRKTSYHRLQVLGPSVHKSTLEPVERPSQAQYVQQPPKTSLPSNSIVQPSQTSTPQSSMMQPLQQPQRFSFHISVVGPSTDQCMHQPSQTKLSHTSKLPKDFGESRGNLHKTSSCRVSRGHHSPKHQYCVPDSQPKPSHKSSHKSRIDKHTKPQTNPSCANPTSSHKNRIDCYTKPSHENPVCTAAPSRNSSHRSTFQGRTHTTSHQDPIPSSTPPSHSNQRETSPGTRCETQSCQRSRSPSSHRASAKRSMPFHNNPESCMF